MSHRRWAQVLIGILLGIVLLAVLGCTISPEERAQYRKSEISIIRYEEDRVTCYVYTAAYAGGISCLRDP